MISPSRAFFVESFDVAWLANLKGSLAVDLEELTMCHKLAKLLSVAAKGADKSRHRDNTGPRHQLDSFTDPANVLSSIVFAKSQIGAETMVCIIAI